MRTITFYEFLRRCLQLEAAQTAAPAAILDALRALRRVESGKTDAPPKLPRSRGP